MHLLTAILISSTLHYNLRTTLMYLPIAILILNTIQLKQQLQASKPSTFKKVNVQYSVSPSIFGGGSVSVSGSVVNFGTITANNVVVTVQIYNSNSQLTGSGTISLGTILGRSSSTFQPQSFSYTGTFSYVSINVTSSLNFRFFF